MFNLVGMGTVSTGDVGVDDRDAELANKNAN
jgi:hypothetical protein